MNSNFLKTYELILTDEERQKEFCKTGIEDDKRVFKILNTNIKTYNTFYKYLSEIVNNPQGDHHQKIKRLKDINLYSENPTESIKNRMSIALKINDAFEERSFIRDFMLFIFSLNTSCKIEESSEFIMDVLPSDVLKDYDLYLKKAYEKQTILNPIYGLYVFYSDKELLYDYINYVLNMSREEKDILLTIDEETDNFLNKKRIHDMQKGAILNEALIGSLYFKLCSINLESLIGYNNIIKRIIKEYKELCDKLNLPNKASISDWEKLERLLNSLSNDEKKELLRCFGNTSESIDEYEPDAGKISTKMSKNYGQGYDAIYTSKYRIGQSRFRKNLIAQFDVIKCRVCGCSINKVDYLKASHILEWYKSNEIEKTDPNNGLLLCPIHDFLFDAHLITFNDDGNILISKNIEKQFYKNFEISDTTKIKILSENIPYLRKHREVFEEREKNQ